MTDVWDIAKYVESHPSDFEQRWRLAKKLYQEEEYRIALEHLQVLRKEWTPKVNVFRYLAATHYRLKRYDEAAAELKTGLGLWPDETSLREQLARVLEVGGHRQEAAHVWEDIRQRTPSHPLAEGAIARLRQEIGGTPAPVGAPADRDSGLLIRSGKVCPKCGEENEVSFDRCWKCHATLGPGVASETGPRPSPAPARRKTVPHATSGDPARVWLFLEVGLAVTFLAVGIYFSVACGSIAQRQAVGLATIRNVYGAVAVGTLFARVIAGLTLLVAWPAAWWAGLKLVDAEEGPRIKFILVGVVLATLTYAISWTPGGLIGFMPLVPAVMSLLCAALAFELSFGQALIVWLVQGIVVLVAGSGAFAAVEGMGPFKQLPAIARYAWQHDAAKDPGKFTLAPARVPTTVPIRWKSTGSPWLDGKANQVELLIECPAPTPLHVELKGERGPGVSRPAVPAPFTLTARVDTNQSYMLVLAGQEGAEVQVTAFGVLMPTGTL